MLQLIRVTDINRNPPATGDFLKQTPPGPMLSRTDRLACGLDEPPRSE
jgi:hypothetical protein